jgi:L-fuconolactonase
MEIVDSQIHLGPGGVDEMVKALDALGIASVMVDEYWMGTPGDPYHLVGEGRNLQRTVSPTVELACWQYPGRFSYLVRPDPRDPELKAVIRLSADNPNVRALRVSPGMTRADMKDFAEGGYDDIFALAVEHGLPVFAQVAGHADLLERVVAKFRDVRIIICHCGMPPGASLYPIFAQMEGLPDSMDYWGKLAATPLEESFDKVLHTADMPQIALKWGHAPVMFGAAGYPNLGARPFLRKALDAFGAERVMWASDISANQTGESWAELIFSIIENPEMSTDEKESVMGRTARKWLDWEVAAGD